MPSWKKQVKLEDLTKKRTVRMVCQKCEGTLFFVDYHEVKESDKAKGEKGIFGTCMVCRTRTPIYPSQPRSCFKTMWNLLTSIAPQGRDINSRGQRPR